MSILSNLSSNSLLVDGQFVNKQQNANGLATSKPVIGTGGTRYSPSITLSSAGFGDLYGPPKLMTKATFSNPDNVSPISQLLARNLAIPPLSHSSGLLFNATEPTLGAPQRLAGGTLRLAELANAGESYEQDIRQYAKISQPDENGKYKNIDLTGFKDLKNQDQASINLKLETRDADVINFSLTSYEGHGTGDDKRLTGFVGTRVSFEFEGELSPDELKQVEAFANSINQASGDYFNSGRLNIEELDLSGFSQFTDIELSFLNNGDGSGDQHFKMSYHDDVETRSIDVNLNGDKSNIIIDKTSLGMEVSDQQQKQALEEYLTLLEDSAKEAHANGGAESLMLNIFSLGFENLKTSEETPTQIQVQVTAEPSTEKQQLQNALVGLPDFNFSFDSVILHPNAENRPNEYIGFSLQLSLETQIDQGAKNGSESITQTQKYHLTAAYYEPLENLDEVDFKNQNYQYTQLERSSEKVTNLVTQNNELILAMTTNQGVFDKITQEYQEGKLEDEDHKHSEHSNIENFTQLAQQKAEYQTHEFLNTVMINPYQIHQKELDVKEEERADGRLIRGLNSQ